jgi:hypothetical protein
MAKVSEVGKLFLEACPTAKPDWEEHLNDWEGEPPAHYIEVSVFAHHLVECYERGQTESFEGVFQLVERLISEGDDDTQGVVIVGFLEGLQNIASHRDFGSVVFEPYLLPKSLSAWRELEEFWEGKNSLMDVIRAESKRP